MLPFIDVFVQVEQAHKEGPFKVPHGLHGAVFFGPHAKSFWNKLIEHFPGQNWHCAEALNKIVGESNARFPARSTTVIDLQLSELALSEQIKHPAEWWPICDALKNRPRFLRLKMSPGHLNCARIKQILRRYPETLFWLDPFVHGPVEGWQGPIRLAEHPNVILTTLGLFPVEGGLWSERAAHAAIEYTIGEVGAAMLLYASGLSWTALHEGVDLGYRHWLEECPEIDDEELDLILYGNANSIFKTDRIEPALES